MSDDLLESSEGQRTLRGCAHSGPATITVWWADGRVTATRCKQLWLCHDVVMGNCHPFTRWEIRAE